MKHGKVFRHSSSISSYETEGTWDVRPKRAPHHLQDFKNMEIVQHQTPTQSLCFSLLPYPYNCINPNIIYKPRTWFLTCRKLWQKKAYSSPKRAEPHSLQETTTMAKGFTQMRGKLHKSRRKTEPSVSILLWKEENPEACNFYLMKEVPIPNKIISNQ